MLYTYIIDIIEGEECHKQSKTRALRHLRGSYVGTVSESNLFASTMLGSQLFILYQVENINIIVSLWRGGKGKRKREAEQEEGEEEDRRAAKAARKKEDTAATHSMEVEMSDMEAVVQQSTLYDELYRAYMMLREPLD